MKRLSLILGVCLVIVVGCQKSAPENAASVVINATVDNTGQHPGTAAVAGPTKLTCLSASGKDGRCYVVGPGVNNIIAPGAIVGTSGAGTVTLNCNGTGNFLQCSLRVG